MIIYNELIIFPKPNTPFQMN